MFKLLFSSRAFIKLIVFKLDLKLARTVNLYVKFSIRSECDCSQQEYCYLVDHWTSYRQLQAALHLLYLTAGAVLNSID